SSPRRAAVAWLAKHCTRTFASSRHRGPEFCWTIASSSSASRFDGAARGQLCDRNVRDDFTQPSNSPDHGIKPVWRAINGAVPLAAEGHHFALELIEAVTM